MNIYKSDIKEMSDAKFSDAVENLIRYNQATNFFNLNFAKYAVGKHYDKPLEKLRVQNSDFRHCCFAAPIIRTNISGSHYSDCKFDNTGIQNSSLQFGTFENCQFRNCSIEGSNFSYSYMADVALNQNTLIGSSFLRTQFKNCIISGGEMLSSSLEFAEFQNTRFEDMRLANLSMEYSEFKDVHMDRVILPFAQIPFIFGGLDYILSTSDSVTISADMGSVQSISVDEYISTFNDWKIFLAHRELYFPLANILLAENRTTEALEVLLAGILTMINHYDFRMLKYLCKLAATHPGVTKEECKKLYLRIKELISARELDEEQQYKWTLHINDIRNILLDNPQNEAKLSLLLQTNILSGSERQLCEIIRALQLLADSPLFHFSTKAITIRHDSPFEIIIIAVGVIYAVREFSNLISQIIHNVKISIEDIATIQEVIQRKSKNDDLESELRELSAEKAKLEIEKLHLEIQEMQQNMVRNNVDIHITHNIDEHSKIYIA